MNIYSLDLKDVKSKEDLYDVIFKALPLPEYCGRNLDALYDVLTSDPGKKQIILSGCGSARESIPEYMRSFFKTCFYISQENPGIEFRVEE